MISAYDSCGRVCRPSCLVPGSTNLYRPCSGALRVNTKQPLMFGNNFGDAVLGVWDFNSEKSCPQFSTDQIYVSFYCDYSDRWPWPTVFSQPGAKDPPTPPAGVQISRNTMKPSPLQNLMSPPAEAFKPIPPIIEATTEPAIQLKSKLCQLLNIIPVFNLTSYIAFNVMMLKYI